MAKTEYTQRFGSDLRSIRFLIIILQKIISAKNADAFARNPFETALAHLRGVV